MNCSSGSPYLITVDFTGVNPTCNYRQMTVASLYYDQSCAVMLYGCHPSLGPDNHASLLQAM